MMLLVQQLLGGLGGTTKRDSHGGDGGKAKLAAASMGGIVQEA